MSEAKHTPEPWRIIPTFPNTIGGEIGRVICECWYRGDRDLTHANARRIVACVNACAGISTEDLERGYVSIRQGNTPHTHAPFFCPNCGNAHDASIMCRGPDEVESCPHCGATPFIREAAPIGSGLASGYRAVCSRCKK